MRQCGFRAQFPPAPPPAPAFVATLLETPGRSRGKSPDSCPTNPCLTLIRRTPCLIHEGSLRKAARNWARDLVGARRQGCRLGAARSAALHEKHANLGYASLTSCLKSPRRGQRPSICEELVLDNSTLKKPTWANAELYGGNHSHRAFQTHISTVFVHDIGFPRKRGRVGGLPNDDASTHFGGRTRGGRLAGWRAAGLRLAGRLAGDKLAASGERANRGRRQPSRRKTVKRGRPRPTPDTERTIERPIPPYAMV